nr:AraC family transcriptional regulator [Ningiella sp. W23]
MYSDAGSGIIFNLVGDVMIGNETLPEGVIMLGINKQTENIVMQSGAQLSGIRFHPAICYGVLGQHYDKPTLLLPEEGQLYNLYGVYNDLRVQKDIERRIETLHRWADKNLDFTKVIPDPLKKALMHIDQDETPGQLSASIDLSQRQIERIFKLWLEMTPKHYQRILRVKKQPAFYEHTKKQT